MEVTFREEAKKRLARRDANHRGRGEEDKFAPKENSLNIGRRDQEAETRPLVRHVSHQVTCRLFMPMVENDPFKETRQQWPSDGSEGPSVLHLRVLSIAT